LIAFGFWYKATYSMEDTASKQVNLADLDTKILIATQGSDFKRAIVTNIVNHFKLDTTFLNIIDVKELNTINSNEYKAIVILHTWEYGNPPPAVIDFIAENLKSKSKLIVMATSGKGTNKIGGIDALSGESIIEDASDYSDEIIERINKILKPNTILNQPK
jgi:hypothetical protein